MPTLQQLLEAPTRLDQKGNYTYVQNPDTGEWEIAYGGFSAPNAYKPQLVDMSGDGSYGYIDPATGRQVFQLGDSDNPRGWAYYDIYGGPEGMGGAGEMVPGSDASNLMLPRSLAEMLQADPNLMPELQRSGVGVAQQNRSRDDLFERYLVPALMAGVGGLALSGAGTLGAAGGGGGNLAQLLAGDMPMYDFGSAGLAGETVASGPVFTGNFFAPQMGPLTGSAVGGAAAGAAGGLTAGQVLSGAGAASSAAGLANGDASGAESSFDQGTGYGATSPGYNLPDGTTLPTPPDSDFLNKLLTGTSLANTLSNITGAPEWLFDAAGKAIPGAIGAYAASQQGDAISTLGDKEDARVREFMAFGAPSRERYEASFAPGFDVAGITGLQGAMDTAGDTLLRRLSAKSGNPYGDPGGLAEVQNYITGNLALPALQNYRNQNASTGGFGAFNTTAANGGNSNQLDLASLSANNGVWGGIADSAASIFTPKKKLKLSDILEP
jgi:hypothetical protein